MDRIRRTLPLRRVAWMAALAALTLPAGQAQAAKKAKAPVITSVSPMKAAVGETLTIKGRNFRKGKGRNSVGFKRDGSAVIFVKSDISTARMLKVKVPKRLEEQMTNQGTTKLAARFRLRILTSRFGPSFTSVKHSPLIGPHVPKGTAGTPGSGSGSGAGDASVSTPPAAEADCDNDGQINSVDLDDDNDLLPDTLENVLGTNGCKADSDDDTVEDGYEYRSAIDLNDDEYQSPNVVLPYPGQRPYPNPLDKNDAGVDYDGDGLTVAEEYGLWKVSTPVAQRTFADVAGKPSPLSYSAGLTYSVSSYCKDVPGNPLCGVGDDNRRVPTLAAGTYDKWLAFTGWAAASGYDPVRLHDSGEWYGHSTGRNDYRLLDMNRAGGVSGPESMNLDQPGRGVGWLADGERDEDADGLSNVDELKSRMTPEYWTACYTDEPVYPVSYAGTDYLDADSDNDGILDGADDQDHDDVPNIMELSRFAALGGPGRPAGLDETDDGNTGTTNGGGPICTPDPDLEKDAPRHAGLYGQVNPFNPCEPDPDSRTCALYFEFGTLPAPFSGPDWWALQ